MIEHPQDRHGVIQILHNMGLEADETEFDDEGNLIVLKLAGLNLTTLPSDIAQFTQLRVLKLGALTAGNRLGSLPPEFATLINLRSLDLSHNGLTSVPLEITCLPNLESLILTNNKLTHVPAALSHLSNLRQLWLNNNALTSLPPELGWLPHLEYLVLTGNTLTSIPPEFSRLSTLECLELSDNPLHTPPPDIVACGKDAILDFLRELTHGFMTRYDVRLLIVGERGVGKTRLFNALIGTHGCEERVTPHEITIRPCRFPHPDNSKVALTCHVWDFGAQHIRHATDQLFFTNSSIFLLVYDARHNAEQARLTDWLHKIRSLAPHAPIVLVATHIDEHPADLDSVRFRALSPHVVGHIGVSGPEGIGIEELKAVIVRNALTLPFMGQKWPQTWGHVETALQGNPKAYIDSDEYSNMCRQQGVVDGTAQTVLAGYLRERGQILYYQDDDTLSNYLVLKPHWVTHALSRMLDEELTYHRHGILAHADLAAIWDKDENGAPYPRALYPYFLKLLRRFKLRYDLESVASNQEVTHSLVPLLLPRHPPENMPVWQAVLPDDPEITLVFRFVNSIPQELMYWIIVHTYLYTTGVHWRQGVRLNFDGHAAQIQIAPGTQELWLNVKGPAPDIFFHLLQHTINDRIVQRYFRGAAYTRQVPCRCHTQRGDQKPCPYVYAYESLIEHLKQQQFFTECGVSFENVSVPELLSGIRGTTHEFMADELQRIQETLQQVLQDTPGDQNIAKALGRINQNLMRSMSIILSRLNAR